LDYLADRKVCCIYKVWYWGCTFYLRILFLNMRCFRFLFVLNQCCEVWSYIYVVWIKVVYRIWNLKTILIKSLQLPRLWTELLNNWITLGYIVRIWQILQVCDYIRAIENGHGLCRYQMVWWNVYLRVRLLW
jgi:hypothetical protein